MADIVLYHKNTTDAESGYFLLDVDAADIRMEFLTDADGVYAGDTFRIDIEFYGRDANGDEVFLTSGSSNEFVLNYGETLDIYIFDTPIAVSLQSGYKLVMRTYVVDLTSGAINEVPRHIALNSVLPAGDYGINILMRVSMHSLGYFFIFWGDSRIEVGAPPVASKQLDGVIAANLSLNGVLTGRFKLSGSVASVSGESGGLYRKRALDGAVSSASGLSGDMWRVKSAGGQASAVSVIVPIDLKRVREIDVQSDGLASLTGYMGEKQGLSGVAGAGASCSAAMVVKRGLSGEGVCASGLSGVLLPVDTMQGLASASALATGGLGVRRWMSGSISASSTVLIWIANIKPFAGVIGAGASVDGEVKRFAGFSGEVQSSGGLSLDGGFKVYKRFAGLTGGLLDTGSPVLGVIKVMGGVVQSKLSAQRAVIKRFRSYSGSINAVLTAIITYPQKWYLFYLKLKERFKFIIRRAINMPVKRYYPGDTIEIDAVVYDERGEPVAPSSVYIDKVINPSGVELLNGQKIQGLFDAENNRTLLRWSVPADAEPGLYKIYCVRVVGDSVKTARLVVMVDRKD